MKCLLGTTDYAALWKWITSKLSCDVNEIEQDKVDTNNLFFLELLLWTEREAFRKFYNGTCGWIPTGEFKKRSSQ